MIDAMFSHVLDMLESERQATEGPCVKLGCYTGMPTVRIESTKVVYAESKTTRTNRSPVDFRVILQTGKVHQLCCCQELDYSELSRQGVWCVPRKVLDRRTTGDRLGQIEKNEKPRKSKKGKIGQGDLPKRHRKASLSRCCAQGQSAATAEHCLGMPV